MLEDVRESQSEELLAEDSNGYRRQYTVDGPWQERVGVNTRRRRAKVEETHHHIKRLPTSSVTRMPSESVLARTCSTYSSSPARSLGRALPL